MHPLRSRMMVFFVAIAAACLPARAENAAAENPTEAIALSRQISAMQFLHDLRPNAGQLQAIRALATQPVAPTTAPSPATPATKVSAKYVAALRELRAALSKPGNDEQISDASDALEEIADDDDVDLDDAVEMTAAARANVPAILSKFPAAQIADYLARRDDDIPDPEQTVMDALDEVRDVEAANVDAVIKEDAEDAGILVSGLDPERSAALRGEISRILASTRKLSADDFAKQRPALERSLKKLVAGTDPAVVSRHFIERKFAELLANPQLANAIDAMPK